MVSLRKFIDEYNRSIPREITRELLSKVKLEPDKIDDRGVFSVPIIDLKTAPFFTDIKWDVLKAYYKTCKTPREYNTIIFFSYVSFLNLFMMTLGTIYFFVLISAGYVNLALGQKLFLLAFVLYYFGFFSLQMKSFNIYHKIAAAKLSGRAIVFGYMTYVFGNALVEKNNDKYTILGDLEEIMKIADEVELNPLLLEDLLKLANNKPAWVLP